MRVKIIFISTISLIALGLSLSWAADHIDAPAVSSTSTDITDFYVFQSPTNNDNMVFVANVQGLLDPTATASASFDEQSMIEFNIDNTGDNVEDLVIQATFSNGMITVYGPTVPSQVGLTSMLETDASKVEGAITAYGSNAVISNLDGIKTFAGPRDDPFFMDFAQFGEILAGNATGFNNPGADTFAGTNVMSVVVEVPKSMLGNATTLNTWVESKRKM